MGGIPEAVKRQERQALELHARTYGGADQDTGKAPAQVEQQDSGQGSQSPSNQQAESANQAGQVGGEGRETDTPTKPDYEQQYRALKGKYDAEVPRLSRELREARDREQQASQELTTLRSEVADLRQRLEQANSGNRGGDSSSLDISDDTLAHYAEMYGDDFLKLVETVAESKVAARMRPIESRIDETSREVKEVGRAMSQREFFRELKQLVPDWEAINKDNGWLEWLGQYDAMAGKTRQDALDEAYANLDYVRMAALFDAYTGKRSANAGNGSASTSQHPSVDSQIEPSKRSGSAERPEKPRYTMNDWTSLQEDARKGKYLGREDEFRRKESEIHAALFSKS